MKFIIAICAVLGGSILALTYLLKGHPFVQKWPEKRKYKVGGTVVVVGVVLMVFAVSASFFLILSQNLCTCPP